MDTDQIAFTDYNDENGLVLCLIEKIVDVIKDEFQPPLKACNAFLLEKGSDIEVVAFTDFQNSDEFKYKIAFDSLAAQVEKNNVQIKESQRERVLSIQQKSLKIIEKTE